MNNFLFTDTEKQIIQELSKSISTSFYNSSFEALKQEDGIFYARKKAIEIHHISLIFLYGK